MKADGNTNSNQTRWSQHTNPCHYGPPLRSFCASNSTSLLQRAQSALMLLCHHLAMLPCCHVIMFPCINIKYFKSTWNQCAWCLEACKSLCVKRMCGSERPNCVCVLHAKKTQQLWKNMCGHGTADSPHHPTSECWEADPCRPTPQSLEEQNSPRKAKKNFA